MTTKENTKCPDCQVDIGELHKWGCDVSRCKETGIQLLSCYVDPDDPDLDEDWEPFHDCAPCVWTGEWPGVKVCRENGWYVKMIGYDEPVEDLNSVPFRAVWNSELEDYEARK